MPGGSDDKVSRGHALTHRDVDPQDSSKTSRAGSTKSPDHLPSPRW